MELLGSAASGVCIACLIALAAVGGRGVRLAVAAFVLTAMFCSGLFVMWLTLYGE